MQTEPDSDRANPESSQKTACTGADTEESAKEIKESRPGTMKEKPKIGIFQRFFQIICLAVTLTSAGFLIYHMVYLPMENKKLVAELKGNFPEPEAPGASDSEKKDQPAGRKCPVAAVDLVSLREQYPDVQGWLTIPDTGIDYPVLQSEQENGEFYLKRNYKKEYDINGSLFLQAGCKVSESRNLIIYGHNMKSGAMFGNLDLYADETYYQEHPFAYLQTEDGIQEYQIVTVLIADRDLFPFQQQLPDAAAVQEYLKAARQREVFETEDDYLKGICDKVLTLISCSYEWSGARNIVLAVPVSGAFWGEKCS